MDILNYSFADVRRFLILFCSYFLTFYLIVLVCLEQVAIDFHQLRINLIQNQPIGEDPATPANPPEEINEDNLPL